MTTTNTHETRRTLAEDVFYPDHEPRTESPTFRASKRAMKAARSTGSGSAARR